MEELEKIVQTMYDTDGAGLTPAEVRTCAEYLLEHNYIENMTKEYAWIGYEPYYFAELSDRLHIMDIFADRWSYDNN